MAATRKSAAAKKTAGAASPAPKARTRTRLTDTPNDATAKGTAVAAVAVGKQLKPALPEGWVMAHSPHQWTLTTDDHAKHSYPKGTCPMPKEHAEHPYAKDNGVTLL